MFLSFRPFRIPPVEISKRTEVQPFIFNSVAGHDWPRPVFRQIWQGRFKSQPILDEAALR